MDSPILSLIEAYRSRVAEACNLFHAKLGVTGNILAAWRRIPIENYDSSITPSLQQEGVLDSSRNITYHGIGCCIHFGSLNVDFDFGPHGRHGGFDAWRLHLYAKTSEEFRELADQDLIQRHLDALVDSGIIVKSKPGLGGHLYYLACDAVR